jgi:hypothetical protein
MLLAWLFADIRVDGGTHGTIRHCYSLATRSGCTAPFRSAFERVRQTIRIRLNAQ